MVLALTARGSRFFAGGDEDLGSPTNDGVGSWVRTPAALLVLFAIGFVIRLILVRHSEGVAFDVGLFRQWSDRLVERGPAHFYEPGYFADYPPGYLYVLFVLGKMSRLLRGEAPSIGVLKLPAIIADLGVAVFALLLAVRINPRGLVGRIPSGVAAAAAILLNPGLILVSAVWGQVDSVLALFVLAGIYALATEPHSTPREVCGVALLAIAVATKPQAILALPIVAIVVVRHHLGVGPPGWCRWSKMGVRVALYVVLGAAIVVAMFAPFGIGPAKIPDFYRSAGSVYQFTSLWAFNVWGAVGFYRRDVGPVALSIGNVAAFYVGLAAFAVATVAIMIRAWRSLGRGVDATAVAVLGAVATTCVAFALLTRMHERYLYLAVAGLAPLVGHRRFGRALLIMSALFFLNVHFVYVLFSGSSSGEHAWTIHSVYTALFGLTKDAWQRKVLSIVTAITSLAVAALGWKWLEQRDAASRVKGRAADGRT
jgi:dolichyl-phosphate-mannose-protein mannosyltransferase